MALAPARGNPTTLLPLFVEQKALYFTDTVAWIATATLMIRHFSLR